jgi:hypothetical protein
MPKINKPSRSTQAPLGDLQAASSQTVVVRNEADRVSAETTKAAPVTKSDSRMRISALISAQTQPLGGHSANSGLDYAEPNLSPASVGPAAGPISGLMRPVPPHYIGATQLPVVITGPTQPQHATPYRAEAAALRRSMEEAMQRAVSPRAGIQVHQPGAGNLNTQSINTAPNFDLRALQGRIQGCNLAALRVYQSEAGSLHPQSATTEPGSPLWAALERTSRAVLHLATRYAVQSEACSPNSQSIMTEPNLALSEAQERLEIALHQQAILHNDRSESGSLNPQSTITELSVEARNAILARAQSAMIERAMQASQSRSGTGTSPPQKRYMVQNPDADKSAENLSAITGEPPLKKRRGA